MNAEILTDLLLELNVVNAKDIDTEVNLLAARVADPRAQKWFKRVVRFFVINIDRLFREPYVAKAEMRGPRASKYYADPRGGWLKGREPEAPPGSPLAVRETYDPAAQTYTSNLHQPSVARDLDQNFTPFQPAKAKAKGLFGGPPVKKELQPWMTAPEAKTKEFHHFDPIQTRRRELFAKLGGVVQYLNYQSRLIRQRDETDPAKKATEAEMLMRRLETMKTDDIAGFREVMKNAAQFALEVKDKPWLFSNDGKEIASSGSLTLRKASMAETVRALTQRGQPIQTTDKKVPEGWWPTWCIDAETTAANYLKTGCFYFVDKNDMPYVLAHMPGRSDDVRDVHDRPISAALAKEIAPLFIDRNQFTPDMLSNEELAAAVNKLRRP